MFCNKIEIENNIYDLKYGVSECDDGSFELIISKESGDYIVDKSIIRIATITKDNLVEIMDTMCRNTVTPMCFREIVEDMIIDTLFVEECRKR